jgi:acyl-CoA thioesterase
MDFEAVKAFFNEKDAHLAHLGVRVASVDAEQATTLLQIGPQHCNAFGIVHAGVLCSLADAALGAAANAQGSQALAVSLHLSFLKPGLKGELKAVARRLGSGRRITNYAVDVLDEQGGLVAVLQGTAYHKSAPFPPVD